MISLFTGACDARRDDIQFFKAVVDMLLPAVVAVVGDPSSAVAGGENLEKVSGAGHVACELW